MIYYDIKLYTNKDDDWDNFPYKGSVKAMKWLRFGGDDNSLQFGEKRVDEFLATKILIENRKQVESTLLATNDPEQISNIGKVTESTTYENDILELLQGTFQKVVVSKYESDTLVNI